MKKRPKQAAAVTPPTVTRRHEGIEPAFSQCSDLSQVKRHVVPSVVLDITREHLRRHGSFGHEGALCWGGTVTGGDALVTTALLFTDAGRWGGIHVSSAHTGLLYAHCHARGLTLLAQVHSHPGPAFHSPVDDQLPHSAEVGFLSVVVPNFGSCTYERFEEWCVCEQVEYETWREWNSTEKRQRLYVLDSVVGIP